MKQKLLQEAVEVLTLLSLNDGQETKEIVLYVSNDTEAYATMYDAFLRARYYAGALSLAFQCASYSEGTLSFVITYRWSSKQKLLF